MNIAAASTKTSSRLAHGTLICLIGTVLWSSTAVFIRYLNDAYHLPSLVLAFWRDAFIFLALLLAFVVAWPALLHIDRRHLRFLLFYGFVLSLFNSLWTVSVAFNGAAVSVVLAYSSSAFTAVLGWRLLAERLDRVKILVVILSILGCVLVSGAYDPATWQVNPLGIITGLLSGVAFAGYSLLGRASYQRGINPWTALLYTFGFAALFLLAYNLFPAWLPGISPPPSLFWLGGALAGWLVLVILAIGPSIGGYGLYTFSLAYLPASVANLIATLEPALTALLAYLLLSERYTGQQLAGSAMILAGVIFLHLNETRLAKGQYDLPATP